MKRPFSPTRMSEEGKQQKQMCFIREKTAWKDFSKQFHLPEFSIITSEMEDTGEGREDHKINVFESEIAGNEDILQKKKKILRGQPCHECLVSCNLLILISIYILKFLLLYSVLVLYFSFQIVHCIYFHSQEVNSV